MIDIPEGQVLEARVYSYSFEGMYEENDTDDDSPNAIGNRRSIMPSRTDRIDRVSVSGTRDGGIVTFYRRGIPLYSMEAGSIRVIEYRPVTLD